MMDSCLGGLVVMTLTQNVRDRGSIRRNPLLQYLSLYCSKLVNITGGLPGARFQGQNFLIFMQFFGKIGQMVGSHPPAVGAPWEILEPPLNIIVV